MNHGLDGWWPWMAEPVREGVEDGIQWRIMANDVLFLWQGYAHIPDGHVRRHLNADGIEPLVDVYGGVAYGPDRQGRIGFDTLQGNSSFDVLPVLKHRDSNTCCYRVEVSHVMAEASFPR